MHSAPLFLAVLVVLVGSSAVAADRSEQATPSRPAAEAVLLGVYERVYGMKTYLIDESGIVELGRGLAVPRSDGWWFFDVHEDHLVVKKGATVTAADFAPIDRGGCKQGEKTTEHGVEVEYVTPAVVSLRWFVNHGL